MHSGSKTVVLAIIYCVSTSIELHAQKLPVVMTGTFNALEKTETPDGVLKQGSYSIRIFDQLADRMIIEIQSQDGRIDQKFLGVPAKNLPVTANSGASLTTGVKGQSALRGFSFSRGNSVEFVYLKNDAVALAKANGSAVLAVDPTSEGIPQKKDLSPEDMKIVTLWLLTPKRVGPNDHKATIQAERYEAPARDSSELAELLPPTVGSATTNTPMHKPSVISRLPKTASELPLIDLIGFFFFAAAISTRLWIMRSTEN